MKNSDSAYLLDSNVLLYLAHSASLFHSRTQDCVAALETKGASLFYTSQNAAEFWAVATRPVSDRGLGFSLKEVAQQLDAFAEGFTLLPEPGAKLIEWREIALESTSIGRHVHDARLAATMRLYGIAKIITKNVRDFQRFPFLQVFQPEDILAGKR